MKRTENLIGKGASTNFRENFVELELEVADMGKGESENYCEVYRELAEIVGDAATRKIWKYYAGLSVDFPQRLYSKEYIEQVIAENMETMKASDIARMVGLSERRVRQIVRKVKESE